MAHALKRKESPDDHIQHITPKIEDLTSIQTNVTCDECQKILPHLSALKLHVVQCHRHSSLKAIPNKNNRWYHCPMVTCIYHESKSNGKHFAKSKYIKQHYLKVHAARKFNCDRCQRRFSTNTFLTAHYNSCGICIECSCKQSFSCIESLQVHCKRYGHVSSLISSDFIAREKRHTKKLSDITKVKDHNRRRGSSSLCPIIPKPEQPHIVAAIALSELALARIKRVSSVNVGTQTDASPGKRAPRKASSPCRAADPRGHAKRKQTTEMETQTRLTNLKKKFRKMSKSGSTMTSSSATGTAYSPPFKPNQRHSSSNSNAINYVLYQHDSVQADDVYANVNYNEVDCNFERARSTSGTQTSPRSSNRMPPITNEEFKINLFKNVDLNYESQSDLNYCISTTSASLIAVNDKVSSCELSPYITNSSINSNTELRSFYPNQKFSDKSLSQGQLSQQIIDDEDNILDSAGDVADLLNIADSGKKSHRPPNLAQIRSSSIETQTDHDVFLSTNMDDDDIFTVPQSMSGKDSRSCDNPNLWCTSETQTCEDFSDIERHLCSTIHTQTQESASELFPELNFADNQTQTGLDDSPSYVTTYTQTVFDKE